MPMEAQKEEKKQKGEDEMALAREIKELLGVDADWIMRVGLLSRTEARKWLVKQHYFRLARTGRTYADIKYELSEKYGMSVSSIEKLVYRKSKK